MSADASGRQEDEEEVREPVPLLRRLQEAYDRELSKLYVVIAKHRAVATLTTLPPDKNQHRRLIREHEEYRLAAQLQCMRLTSSITLSTDRRLALKLTEENLRGQVQGARDLLEYLKEQKKKETENGKTLDEHLEEERRILAIVRNKCVEEGIRVDDLGPEASAADESRPDSGPREEEPAESQKIRELQERVQKLRALKELRMSQLKDFLEKYFPPLTEYEDVRSGDIFDFGAKRPMRSLAGIVQDLVSAYLANPSDCYLEIDSSMWRPHVEFLLRCKVAIRHPNNASLFRLERFVD